MKFLIWPRQYGKSYRLMQWWVEDPAHRVILVENTNVAKQRQADLLPMLQEAYPENTHRENRLLLRNRIYSYRTWRGYTLPKNGDLRRCQIAVDGLEYALNDLFHGFVVLAAGAGHNEVPDPEIADRADKYHREMREKYSDLMSDEDWAEGGY